MQTCILQFTHSLSSYFFLSLWDSALICETMLCSHGCRKHFLSFLGVLSGGILKLRSTINTSSSNQKGCLTTFITAKSSSSSSSNSFGRFLNYQNTTKRFATLSIRFSSVSVSWSRNYDKYGLNGLFDVLTSWAIADRLGLSSRYSIYTTLNI